MMDELVQELSQKTGLSPEKSQEVINVVMTHLKTRLPGPLAGGLDSLMAGSSAGAGGVGDEAQSVLTRMESIFGKKS